MKYPCPCLMTQHKWRTNGCFRLQSVIAARGLKHCAIVIPMRHSLCNGEPMATDAANESRACAMAPPASNSTSLDLRRAYLNAMTTGREESHNDNEKPTLSLEALLIRAKSLSRQLPYKDTRGRLLQSALLRRDHALLAAVIQAVEKSPFEPVPNASSRVRRKCLLRSRTVLHTSERPTRRPPQRQAS